MTAVLVAVVLSIIPAAAASLARLLWLRRSRSRSAATAHPTMPDPASWHRQAADRLTQLTSADHACVLAINLDRITRLNRRHGHHVGDALLAAVEALLLAHVGPTGLATRLADDHFLLLLAADAHQAKTTAEAISRNLRHLPTTPPGAAVAMIGRPTASIGVAVYPTDGHTLIDLVVTADVLLFVAKDTGRNQIQFTRRTPTTVGRQRPQPLAG